MGIKEWFRQHTVALFCLLFAALLVVAVWYYPLVWLSTPPHQRAAALSVPTLQDDRLNINTASAADLTALPGIGEKKAAAIVAYRDANGPFTELEQLVQVDGIGEGILEKIKPHICI